MTTPAIASFGSWKSPITTDDIISAHIALVQVVLDADDIYWLERRPMEKGRCVLVTRSSSGTITDITPPDFNVRTCVNEYGGGAFVVRDGIVYFSNFSDGRVYCQEPNTAPRVITPPGPMHFADFTIDAKHRRLICVREDHTDSESEAVTTLAAIHLDNTMAVANLVQGDDFYSSPRISPDNRQLTWLSWNHPNMPWDGTTLWLADINDDGTLDNIRSIAGGENESICHPVWSPDGDLHFISDRTGWWNLYRRHDDQIDAVYPMEAEFGTPHWVFGTSTYAFVSAHLIVCAFCRNGQWRMAKLDTTNGVFRQIDLPHTLHKSFSLCANEKRVVYIGASPTAYVAVVAFDLDQGVCETIHRSTSEHIDTGYISAAQAIEFPTEGGLTAHGFFYPPANKDFTATDTERPPLVVMSHGGPTSATTDALDVEIQYWTSRGIAVLDVNYGGSTGYGREYRQRLNGRWGIVDVDDCINGARFLAADGKVDGNRLAIRGGSAGGYTTLAALTFRDVFHAGCSRYGVSDLQSLARDTHKFESYYMDHLVGPYPEAVDLYIARSPIHFIAGLSSPVIFFQGLDDKVVPPDQAEKMYRALKNKGIPTAYIPFEGEQHGFRIAENIKAALDGELYFYSRVFGFHLADDIKPVEIDNL
ncbi:MAG: S9 family peptidase [candidate division Zixibacteria bacterium]|nr:S9 family peptidase [candidate division Zixibacteria bacterium]